MWNITVCFIIIIWRTLNKATNNMITFAKIITILVMYDNFAELPENGRQVTIIPTAVFLSILSDRKLTTPVAPDGHVSQQNSQGYLGNASDCRMPAYGDCFGATYCGPYGMIKDYWKDAWEPGDDFLSCMANWTCASLTLDNYIDRSADMKNVNVLIWLLCETVPMFFFWMLKPIKVKWNPW